MSPPDGTAHPEPAGRSRMRGARISAGMLATLVSALAISPGTVAAQDLSFVTKFFEGVRAVAISFNFVQINPSGVLESDGSCPLSEACGGQAEVLLDLATFEDEYSVELGLSASYLRGFRAVSDEVDLRGSTRSFPTVAAYVSRDMGNWSPYLGLSFGLSELWNARAYDPGGVVYKLEGQTFDWGMIAGTALKIGPGWIFFEGVYTWRTFTSVDWQLPSRADEVLPPAFPRALDFSGSRLNVGFQFQFKNDDP